MPRLALSVDGLADPPIHVTPKVRFDARQRTATLTVVTEGEDEPPRRSVTRYQLTDGVYVKACASKRSHAR